MDTESTAEVLKTGAAAAVSLFLLLLLAPWVPPQLAFFGAFAIFMLGAVVFFGGRVVHRIIVEEIEAYRESKRPDEGTAEYIRQQYADGEITEAEMKRRLDDVLDEEAPSSSPYEGVRRRNKTERNEKNTERD